MSETPNTENQTVSPASEFKKRSADRLVPKPLTLPSGLVVMVTRPSISKLIAIGHVPQDVAAVLMNAQQGAKPDPKSFPKLLKLQEIIAIQSVQSPKITEKPTDDEISLDDLEDEDLAAIMNYVQEGNSELKSFRSESNS